jgi:wyosine [tRNA(Phe)-imidazoG37] synthetase (radical SAM superfamily)
MGTFLFDSIVFGPVSSRRLGVSLGINLLPSAGRCAPSTASTASAAGLMGQGKEEALPHAAEVYEALRKKLSEMKEQGKAPDVITYAGNGEPTLHPDFA